jgi:hypothetical protein
VNDECRIENAESGRMKNEEWGNRLKAVGQRLKGEEVRSKK